MEAYEQQLRRMAAKADNSDHGDDRAAQWAVAEIDRLRECVAVGVGNLRLICGCNNLAQAIEVAIAAVDEIKEL